MMRPDPASLLLDTHAWVWLNLGVELSERSLQAIEQAAASGGLWVSVISVWEVSLLHAKGRLRFGMSCIDWVERALAPPVVLATLTPIIAVESNALPAAFHDDPADRMITATARVGGHTLLTRDRLLLGYSGQGHLAALAC